MRTIDADALKELFSEVIGHIAQKPEMNGNLEHMIRASAMVIQMIDDAPTVQPDTTTHDSIPAETSKNDGDGTSGDLISRQQAIDALRAMQTYKLFAGDDMILVDKAQVQTELMMLPSAQPEQRWIPVKERLPEDEYVLISKKPTKISGSKWSVAIAIRTADPRSRKIQWRNSGFGIIPDDKVLAWMPLPEPYQEGEQE